MKKINIDERQTLMKRIKILFCQPFYLECVAFYFTVASLLSYNNSLDGWNIKYLYWLSGVSGLTASLDESDPSISRRFLQSLRACFCLYCRLFRSLHSSGMQGEQFLQPWTVCWMENCYQKEILVIVSDTK